MTNPEAAVIWLDTIDLVVALAEAAYSMGAKDAHNLCLKETERMADRAIGSRNSLLEEHALGAAQVLDEINELDPARAMPDFTGAAIVALGEPTSDGTEPEPVDVMDIVAEYLAQHGYDGLYDDDCGCELPDLAPCGNMGMGCRPGYRTPCTCGDYDYHIGPKRAADMEPDGEDGKP